MIFNLILILGYLKLYASYDKDIYLLFVYDQIMISLILVYTNVIYTYIISIQYLLYQLPYLLILC